MGNISTFSISRSSHLSFLLIRADKGVRHHGGAILRSAEGGPRERRRRRLLRGDLALRHRLLQLHRHDEALQEGPSESEEG